MIRIMILEDQETSRKALKEMIVSTGNHEEIIVDSAASFDEAREFVESDNVYAAFFLDINLNENDPEDKSGMEVAKLIRSYTKYEFTPVVMVTSIAGLEMESYRHLHCYQYIVKPYIKNDVENVVKKLLAMQNKNEEKSIVVKRDGINYRIKCSAIVYVQAVTRGVCLYLKRETMKVPYLTIVKLMEQLDSDEFVQCHRMFVVNRKYIENIDFVNRMIKMSYYDESIEIGRTYKNKVREILDRE